MKHSDFLSEEQMQEALNWVEDYFAKDEATREYVKSESYMNWFVSFMNTHKNIYDDMFDYEENADKTDKKNVNLLCYLQDNIADIAEDKGIAFLGDGDSERGYWFKYKNRYYEIMTCGGQGTFTTCTLLTKKPRYYVTFDV